MRSPHDEWHTSYPIDITPPKTKAISFSISLPGAKTNPSAIVENRKEIGALTSEIKQLISNLEEGAK